MLAPLIAGGAVILAGGIFLYANRGKLDILAAHGQDLIRHLLSAILLLGTASGTIWTFSNGQLTLSHALETLLSVGGVAVALEWGAIVAGLYIQKLDLRILTARRAADRKALEARRLWLYCWFGGIVACSVGANLVFRVQQLHNVPLAVFVSLVPALLITLFTIVLRPLPHDYAEMGRQAAQQSLVVAVRQAGSALPRIMRKVTAGDTLNDAEAARLRASLGLIAMFAPAEQAQALDHITGQGRNVVQADAELYWTADDICDQYGKSRRTAQDWLGKAPGRRRVTGSQAWEAPRSALIAAHGPPAGPMIRLIAPAARRTTAQNDADAAQLDAEAAQLAAEGAQSGAAGA